MDDRLKGKVAIVTGAGSSGPGIGNGRAAVIVFARKGARVLLVDQNETAAKETLDMIVAEKGEAHAPASRRVQLSHRAGAARRPEGAEPAHRARPG